jgi:4-nitrophenol 2-monooxygenase / 4-nitrocatechol 4-monooxygenase, reductase component
MTVDRDLFRQVAGSFASGVTIVTTGQDDNYHGMTASSFSSLSLDPPLILVCFDLTAATLAAVDATGAFVINILGSEQEQLSRQFASRGAHSLDGVGFELGELNIPILDDVLAHFECRVARQHIEGDHVILVGEVIAGAVDHGDDPLLYFRGSYRRLDRLPDLQPVR